MAASEAFLDAVNFESVSGLTFAVERPVKYAGNPVWPTLGTSEPDWGEGYISAHHDAGTGVTAILAACFNENADYVSVNYAETTDGHTMTRPDLGIVQYPPASGNRHNDLVLPLDTGGTTDVFGHFSHEPGYTTPFLIVARHDRVATMPVVIYAGTDRKNYAKVKTVATPSYFEAMAIIQRDDDRWLIYGQSSIYNALDLPANRQRSIGAYLSDTTDPLGAWTYQGNVLTSPSVDEQYYHCGAFKLGENIVMPVGLFDGSSVPPVGTFTGTDNRIHDVGLAVSRITDGLTFTWKDTAWIQSTGVQGEWEGAMVMTGNQPATVGDEVRMYYGGSERTHHQGGVNTRKMGYAAYGRDRLGVLSGTGTATRKLYTSVLESATVTLNSEGTTAVELLDASGVVVPGYAVADCDAIPADTYGHLVTWNGQPYTPQAFKVKLHGTLAGFHFLDIADTDLAAGPLVIDPTSASWSQLGDAITVRAVSGGRTVTTATVTTSAGGTVMFAGTDAAKFQVSSDGTTWASSLAVAAGSVTVHLAVNPSPGDTALTASVGVVT